MVLIVSVPGHCMPFAFDYGYCPASADPRRVVALYF